MNSALNFDEIADDFKASPTSRLWQFCAARALGTTPPTMGNPLAHFRRISRVTSIKNVARQKRP